MRITLDGSPLNGELAKVVRLDGAAEVYLDVLHYQRNLGFWHLWRDYSYELRSITPATPTEQEIYTWSITELSS